MYPDNNWYGHREILLKYVNKKDKVLFCNIQHGYLPLKINNYNKIYGNRKFTSAPCLVWNHLKQNQSREYGIKNIHAIGASFLYLQKIKKKKKIKSKGTIVFPQKKNSELPSDNKYIENLLNLVESKYPGPYSICLGYDEFINEGFVKKINDRKWNIVTCGKRSDTKFLYKLDDFINKHSRVVITYASTILLYSLFLKKTIFIEENFFKNKKKFYFHRIRKHHNLILKDLKDFGIDFNNLNSTQNYKKAGLLLGSESLKSKKELELLLGINSIWKKFFAKIFSIFYDLAFGANIRKGIVLMTEDHRTERR